MDSALVSDICNLLFVIFGISISLFIMVYSFIFTKKEELKELNKYINTKGHVSPLMTQRFQFCINYIVKWHKININLMILSILTFFSYFIIYGVKKYSLDYLYKYAGYWAIFIILYFMYIVIKIFLGYLKTAKI